MPFTADHPEVEQIMRTGYPSDMQQKNCGSDALGNEIWTGDVLLAFDDEVFVKEELSSDAVQVLEMLGAERKIAK